MKNLARVSTPPNLLASSCSTIGLSKCRRQARVRLIPSPMGCCEGRLVRKAGPLQLCPNQSPASRGERAVVLIKVERKIGSHRLEEHTSELQSLMRIPYAAFCLKKKKTNKPK